MNPSRVAALVMDLAHEAARGEPVLTDVLELLDRAVGADVLSSSVAMPLNGNQPAEVSILHAPPLTAREEREWLRLLPTHPFAMSLGDGPLRTARLTDRMSIRELESLEVYELLLEPRSSRYQLAATLTAGSSALSLIALWRADADFTDAELELVEMVRRSIAAALAYRTSMLELSVLAGPAHRSAVLTQRQKDVCRLVAHGLTNAQIGTRLGVTERTVRKHLEDVFARTGCASRTAVALWWRSSARVADAPLSPAASAGPR